MSTSRTELHRVEIHGDIARCSCGVVANLAVVDTCLVSLLALVHIRAQLSYLLKGLKQL